jgi:diguanylate cyclase (GGDEF)-like protein
MRETTALLELAVDGAPGVVDAAQAIVDHLAEDGGAASVYLARAGRLRRVASRGAWLAPDGIAPGSEVLRGSLPIGTIGRLAVESAEPLDLDHLRACAAALARRIEAHPDGRADDGARRLLRHLVDMAALEDGHAIAGALLGAALDLAPLQSAILVRAAPAGAGVATAVGPLADALRAADLAPLLQRVQDRSSWATTTHGEPPTELRPLERAGVESLVAVPLDTGQQLVGALILASGHRTPVHTDDVELLEQLAAHAASCLRASERLRSLSDRAASDPLTGLGHHATFHEALAASHRRPRTAVVLCDLDGFKRLNDTRGHAYGDRVLCGVADAMSGALRRGDRLFRIGGDEFAALIVVDTDAEALDAAQRLRDAVAAARLGVTASMGVAVPRDGESDAALLARADRALYAVKAHGRDGVALAPKA